MNCDRFEELIALQAGGDLPPRQARHLAAHLTACGSCRRFAEELGDSQAALHRYGDADFDERLLADLRHDVLAEIARGQMRLRWWERLAAWFGLGTAWRLGRVAAAGAVFALLITAGLMLPSLWHSLSRVELTASAPELPRPKPPVFAPQSQAPQPQERPGGQDVRRPRRPQHSSGGRSTLAVAGRVREVKPAAPRRKGEMRPGDTTLAQAAAPSVTKIEFQTADPSIRIIWFFPGKPDAPPAAVTYSSD